MSSSRAIKGVYRALLREAKQHKQLILCSPPHSWPRSCRVVHNLRKVDKLEAGLHHHEYTSLLEDACDQKIFVAPRSAQPMIILKRCFSDAEPDCLNHAFRLLRLITSGPQASRATLAVSTIGAELCVTTCISQQQEDDLNYCRLQGLTQIHNAGSFCGSGPTQEISRSSLCRPPARFTHELLCSDSAAGSTKHHSISCWLTHLRAIHS